jgi:hypothetical protein
MAEFAVNEWYELRFCLPISPPESREKLGYSVRARLHHSNPSCEANYISDQPEVRLRLAVFVTISRITC